MKHTRPRSADIGGLHLATAGSGFGQGWLGYSCEIHTRFAELLSDMYNETLNAVNERGAEFALTDLPAETRARLIHSLDSWNFEPHKLPDEEVLSCTMILFEALFRIEGMQESVGVSLNQIYPLIHHLRRIYRWENTYHNFEHALDVLQCCYIFLRSASMVPPVSILLDQDPERTWKCDRAFDSGPLMTCLGAQELFVTYIVAIGHDVAHPGFTNLFMKNAEAPLSMVYDGKSALEQMHCSLLLRVMRHHGLGQLLDDFGGQRVRKLLSETVLATDMSVHGAFMENFRRVVEDGKEYPTREERIRKEGENQLWRRQVLICQAIMKCADISNPSRPYHVSQHWAAALMGEWTSQAMLERCMDLPCTVQSSDDPLSEAKSQVFFIKTFARPLLELIVEAVPELQPHLDQCEDNLRLWDSRRAELEKQAEAKEAVSIVNANEPSSDPDLSGPRSLSSLASSSGTSPPVRFRRDDYLTAFPLALPKHHPYRNVAHAEQFDDVRLDSPTSLPLQPAPQEIENELRMRAVDIEGEDEEGKPQSSCTSTATSVTLVWPTYMGDKQQQSEVSVYQRPRTSITTSLEDFGPGAGAGTDRDSESLSEPASPCDSASGSSAFFSPSSESEYHSVLEDWPGVRSRSCSKAGFEVAVTGTTAGRCRSRKTSAASGVVAYSTTGSVESEVHGACSCSSSRKRAFSGLNGSFKFGQAAAASISSANGYNSQNACNENGHHHHSNISSVSSAVPDTHAAFRAAAESAGAGLRKKRSMLSRNSWSPSVGEVEEVREGGVGSTLRGTEHSSHSQGQSTSRLVVLPPPPMTSPAALGGTGGADAAFTVPSVAINGETTSTVRKLTRKSTIVVAQPHPREVQPQGLPV